jgi:predicted amidophosphoribosyltransferase
MGLVHRVSRTVAPPFCWACGADAEAGPLCTGCRWSLRWLGPEPVVLNGLPVWAPVAYEGPARALVSGLKYRGAAGLAAPLAACAKPGTLAPPAVLVPVPLHPPRLRRRGFNQAERLAVELGRRTGARHVTCLRRRGPGQRQVGRGREERLASGPVVEVVPRAQLPARAVIVDDVVTTGATVAACAAALGAAGVEVLGAIAYARTLGR